jgi:hypothetical protein
MSSLGEYILIRLPRVYTANEYAAHIVNGLQSISAVLPPQEISQVATKVEQLLENHVLDSNVVQVNDIEIIGTGQQTDPWGPSP